MNNLMRYKGYIGSVEYSEEDEVLFGKVQGIRSLIAYQGQTIHELKQAFHECIDEYLEDCQNENKEPEKPYKGCFNVRVGEELHYEAAILAMQEPDGSLNKIVIEALKEYIEKKKCPTYRSRSTRKISTRCKEIEIEAENDLFEIRKRNDKTYSMKEITIPTIAFDDIEANKA